MERKEEARWKIEKNERRDWERRVKLEWKGGEKTKSGGGKVWRGT